MAAIAALQRLSPEFKYAFAVTIWGIAFLPQTFEQFVLAISTPWSTDFEIFAGASQLAWGGGDPYTYESCRDCAYRYSPLFAYLFVPFAAMGHGVWAALHYLAVLAFPIRIAKFIPLMWPFWWDVGVGSNMIFVAVSAFYALRGHRWAVVTTLAVALLVPRPLMVPLAAWILWKHPWSRLPFAMGALVMIGFAQYSGHLESWLQVLASSGSELKMPFNVGPSAIVGAAWVPIGALLGIWLVRRGRVGLASLVMSPYWLPYYLLMPIADLQRAVKAAPERRSQRADEAYEGVRMEDAVHSPNTLRPAEVPVQDL